MRCRPGFRRSIAVLTRFPYANSVPVARKRDRTRGLRFIGAKAQQMTKLLFVIPVVMIASAASAQQDRQQGQDACARDVSRYCRAQMQEGDQVVLACLKQNRAKISKGCQQVLASHGQ
jgi:hypothetical protein